MLFFVRRISLGYLSSDESEESDKEDSEKPGSESGSAGMFGTVLGRLLHGIGLPLGFKLFADDSFDVDVGSLAVP